MQKFSEWLRKSRKDAGYTTQQAFLRKLQEYMGRSKPFSMGTIGNWESGKNDPEPETMAAIREILKLQSENWERESQPKEPITPYTTGSVPVELMSDELLGATARELGGAVVEARGQLGKKILEALSSVKEEQNRRMAEAGVPSFQTNQPDMKDTALLVAKKELAQIHQRTPEGTGHGGPGASLAEHVAPGSSPSLARGAEHHPKSKVAAGHRSQV